MIPLSLSIEGLYSYKEKQVIDFETLTSNGLFGIFGEVGSGKSSILEAIMFVLFDDTERLNKSGDDRYYNMLNLQSKRFSIDFIFMAGKGNREKYRFACTAKRNSNPDKFEDVKISKHDRQHYRWQAGEWLPLEGIKDATEILGMDYRNFKQTIIIPQGRFREFVDQTSGDRTRMLKELFRLHSYDLGPQTGRLQKDTDLKIQHVQGQLESLGDCDPDKIKVLKEEIESLQLLSEKLQQKIEADQQQELEQQQLQKLHQQLLECKKRLSSLENEQESWTRRAQQLKTYSQAYQHFYEKLRQQHIHKQEFIQKQEQSRQKAREHEQKKQQQQTAAERFAAAKKAFEQKDQIQRKIEDLQRIIKLKDTEDKLRNEQQKHQELEKTCKQAETNSQEAKERLLDLESRLEKLDRQLPDITRLSETYQWYLRKEELEAQEQKAANNLAECKEELEENRKQRSILLKPWPSIALLTDWPQIYEGIDKLKQSFNTHESSESLKLRELQVQQKLTDYADNLQDGHACPLCGATEHPKPAKSEHLAEACRQQQHKINTIKEKQEQLHLLLGDLKALQTTIKNFEQNLQQQQTRQAEQQEQLKVHLEAFAWPEYKQSDQGQLKVKLSEARQARESMQAVKEALAKAKKEREEKAAELEARFKCLQETEKEISMLQGALEGQKGALHSDNLSWLKHDKQVLQDSLQKGQARLQEISNQYENSQQALNLLNEQSSALQAQNEALAQNVAEIQQKLQKQQDEIAALCEEKGFGSIEKIREILALRLDIEQEEKLISDYRQKLHSIRENVKTLEQETAGREYHPEAHRQLQQSIRETTEQCEAHKTRKSKLEQQKSELESRLSRSKDLIKELEQLELRRDNLKEMAALFRGSGFVDYVSTIYLQDLCRVANERFFKLTRNNLSLELNEQNNFIVRDYLNGGRTRLLKTLSGGQTFQAALCLALAMAENIKSLNEAEQSFFFLDEGFGALDKESLRIVFDTLKSLRHENRIVGVISHVEELQQEIEIYLKVENDAEKGSLVSCSWE
jgi:exonuclease SbcC